MSETDTPRQRRLDVLLKDAGQGESWRRWLLEQKAAGTSNVQIAYWLDTRHGYRIDPSTVARWMRQAEEEIAQQERTEEKRAAEPANAAVTRTPRVTSTRRQ
jgi:hypothetical protein